MLLRLFVAFTLFAAACLASDVKLEADQKLFGVFKAKYNKHYRSKQEEGVRFQIFRENMRKAEMFNKQNPYAIFGVNEFSDESAAEFKVRHSAEEYFKYQMQKPKNFSKPFTEAQIKNLRGSSIDWRDQGAVTRVKNQGKCGGCWAFSSAGNIEGQWFLAGNTLASMSPQNLISCDTTNYGCNGGIMDTAWEWLISAQNGGIATDSSYPFDSADGVASACQGGWSYGAYISSYQDVQQSESQMAAYLYTNGPISIAIDATSFQTYNGGVLTNCISQKVDHAVLLVGYDDNYSPPYWIIKNSWGTGWGESGYIRVEKGTDQCLITTIPCTAIVGSGQNKRPIQKKP